MAQETFVKDVESKTDVSEKFLITSLVVTGIIIILSIILLISRVYGI